MFDQFYRLGLHCRVNKQFLIQAKGNVSETNEPVNERSERASLDIVG